MNETDPVHFYFDYVDPFSLILQRRLEARAEKGTVLPNYRPMEVNPPPGPLLNLHEPEWTARWDAALKTGKELGMELSPPWIVPWSRKAHELACLARQKESFREIHADIFHAYLIEGKDIGRVDILTDIARQRGLDPHEVKAALDVDRYRKDVEDARVMGIREGVEEIPCLHWQGRRLSGNPTAAELDRFLAAEPELD